MRTRTRGSCSAEGATAMIVRLTKHADGDTVLECFRPDGSSSWQRQQRRRTAFFPLHDLTHFAIETELGFRSGFYGLLAAGGESDDPTGKGKQGRLPPDAPTVEHLGGALDLARAGRVPGTATELADPQRAVGSERRARRARSITDDDLSRVRSRLLDLVGQWQALPAGEALELSF